ncbi:ABC transporter permease [Kribbella sp.]|uniref:ABC transporter permease n=1 Tax=Kribbella sp. TaxID=1871183 RepID=UPI002D70224A|nr:ABC transporter permease [Kribbella sp.]HZX05728.1 ABC transporter permease [Kribbella sp.]
MSVSTTATEALQEDGPAAEVRRTPWWANQRIGLLILVVLLSALFGVLRPAFFNQQLVIFPLLRDVAMFTVVGLAQLCVLSIGHMNLAVGRMAAFSMMITGISYDLWHFTLYSGLLVGLVAGTAIGALAGWVIARTGVNSFVVTLALDFLLLGLIPLVYTALTDNAAFVTKPPGMRELRNYSLADICIGNVCGSPAIPQLAVFAVVAMAVVGWIFARTRLGRELLMTGSSVRAAELSGIPTARRVIVAHAMSGCLAALAGFMLAVSTGSIKATIGEEFMLPSFLGPILGGTLLAGGFVSIWGTLLGTALTTVIRKGLDLLGVGLESLNIYLGLILLLALSTDRVRTVLSERQSVVPTRRRPRAPEGDR